MKQKVVQRQSVDGLDNFPLSSDQNLFSFLKENRWSKKLLVLSQREQENVFLAMPKTIIKTLDRQ